MFYKLVARNSKRNRKDNTLYFSSMIISIIAFYIILSLSEQSVIKFLIKMESEAIDRLLRIVPVFFVFTLFIIFFLVYYASSIQMEKRKHEFGVYFTLGMKKSKLFKMLILEDLRNNLIALGIGIPVAILISELISLVSSKVVGFGIIGHSFTLSITAIAFTMIGFIIVKFLAILVLGTKVIRNEIGDLLSYKAVGTKKQFPKIVYIISMIIGILMLSIAYYNGISFYAWMDIREMTVTIVLGTIGTILLFYGIRIVIEYIIKLGSEKKLFTYNFRQIEELVIHKSTVLAICSLLIFSAISLFSAGVSIAIERADSSIHILDYTFKDNDLIKLDIDKINAKLQSKNIDNRFSKIVEIKISEDKEENRYSLDSIIEKMEQEEQRPNIENFIDNLKRREDSTLISLSGYNELKELAGIEPLVLKQDEAILYMGPEFLNDEELLNSIIKTNPELMISNSKIKLVGELESLPIVTDSEINIYMALIVSDEVFEKLAGIEYDSYYSASLNKKLIEEKSLMGAIFETNEILDETMLDYESYIQNIGRQLFYTVSTSYLSLYLSTIFIVVANTIIGVLFLMGQRRSYKRYQTLIHLGADYEILSKSSNKQINWYFGLPIFVALINSIFGVKALLNGVLSPSAKLNIQNKLMIAGLAILLLSICEYIYIGVVKKNSNRYLWTLMEPKREE